MENGFVATLNTWRKKFAHENHHNSSLFIYLFISSYFDIKVQLPKISIFNLIFQNFIF